MIADNKSPKNVEAGKKAARTRKAHAAARQAAKVEGVELVAEQILRTAVERAGYTAKWANTMTKWLISGSKRPNAVKWQLVAFRGPHGGESRGIVDLIAIRKDHRTTAAGIKKGDFFQIVLIQVKGGTAPWPTAEDVERRRQVAKHHNARCVVLATWQKGGQPILYRLGPFAEAGSDTKARWVKTEPNDIFG